MALGWNSPPDGRKSIASWRAWRRVSPDGEYPNTGKKEICMPRTKAAKSCPLSDHLTPNNAHNKTIKIEDLCGQVHAGATHPELIKPLWIITSKTVALILCTL